MYVFCGKKFDDQLFFTDPLFLGALSYKNTKGFKEFLKIINADSNFSESKYKEEPSEKIIIRDSKTSVYSILKKIKSIFFSENKRKKSSEEPKMLDNGTNFILF